MREICEKLLAILTAEIGIHEKLFAAMEQKRAAIIAGKVADLENALNAEYELIENLTAREKDRVALMTAATAAAAPKKPLALRAFIAQIPDEYREIAAHLDHAREKLKTALTGLQIKTRQNAELLKASMDHVHAFLDLLTNFGSVKTYNRQGKAECAPARLLDRSA